jgi:hypothetical protein
MISAITFCDALIKSAPDSPQRRHVKAALAQMRARMADMAFYTSKPKRKERKRWCLRMIIAMTANASVAQRLRISAGRTQKGIYAKLNIQKTMRGCAEMICSHRQ